MNRHETSDDTGARQLLNDALATIEDGSTREWALSAHNAPIFEGMARRAIDSGNADPVRFATRILCLQMGL